MKKTFLILSILFLVSSFSLSACGKGKLVEDITMEEGR
jgi:hypothetical protein